MLKLLIVEDNPKLRLALQTGLEQTGRVQVSYACDNGEAALSYTLDQPPEVVLMDVHRPAHAPLELLEPHEQAVAQLLAQGLSNEQIATRLGFRDKRTISRINGQIYAAWGLDMTATDEKVARTRAALILREGRLILWEAEGQPKVLNQRGEWVDWS